MGSASWRQPVTAPMNDQWFWPTQRPHWEAVGPMLAPLRAPVHAALVLCLCASLLHTDTPHMALCSISRFWQNIECMHCSLCIAVTRACMWQACVWLSADLLDQVRSAARNNLLAAASFCVIASLAASFSVSAAASSTASLGLLARVISLKKSHALGVVACDRSNCRQIVSSQTAATILPNKWG